MATIEERPAVERVAAAIAAALLEASEARDVNWVDAEDLTHAGIDGWFDLQKVAEAAIAAAKEPASA